MVTSIRLDNLCSSYYQLKWRTEWRNIREVFQWSILNHFFQFKSYKRLFGSKFKFFGLIEPRLHQGLTRSRIFKKTSFKENRFFCCLSIWSPITPHEVPCNIFRVHKSTIYPKSNITAMQLHQESCFR